MTGLGVIVPAGGRGRRLSGDKLTADVTGRALLDRTLDGLPDAAVVVCVGRALDTIRAVTWVQEVPAFGGPLAAVEAGVAALPLHLTTVLLVGADMPDAGRAVPSLLATLGEGPDLAGGADTVRRTSPACAVVTDATGRRQPLLSVWPRSVLVDRLGDLAPTVGRPLAALLDTLTEVVEVVDVWGAAHDVDTPSDLEAARERYEQPNP